MQDLRTIAISDAILRKPGPLTPDGGAVIETPPAVGCGLVSPVRKRSEVLPAVPDYHERWLRSG